MDKFLIAPFDKGSGLKNDVEPWLIPDNAFSELNNAYLFEGRVRKRYGSKYLGNDALSSRLRVQIGTTDGAGWTPPGTFVPLVGGLPAVPINIGQMFSIGTELFTYNVVGAHANMLRSGASTLATFDNASGELVIHDSFKLTPIYYYPALPVMSLITHETDTINDELLIAFDTRFAYQYVLGGWERLAGAADLNAAIWNGDNFNFFWGCTWSAINAYTKIFFVTNFNTAETNYMRYLQAGLWHNFRPDLGGGNFLNSCRIIVSFKNRLVAFNTWEGAGAVGNNYPNRCRYSQVGDPLDANAWLQTVQGRGSAIDAATTEAIITVAFIRDRLIVYFERSTWELVYTGNQAYPFSWQKINTELGAESTHSVIALDDVALGVGNVGIMACDGTHVRRIDNSIPAEVFKIRNINFGIPRVQAIRDFENELVFWTFPNQDCDANFPYPNKVLVYNYKTATWSFFDDSITSFGYFQNLIDVTWDSEVITWDSEVAWDSGSLQAQFRHVICGNQQGYTFLYDADIPTNASVLNITDITIVNNIVRITSPNHNLRLNDYIYLSGVLDTVGNLILLNDRIFQVISTATDPITPTQFSFRFDALPILAGTYLGGGLLSRVSQMNIKTKEFNFYAKDARNAHISKVNFLVNATSHGKIEVYNLNSTSIFVTPLAPLLGTSTLDTFPYDDINNPDAPFNYELTSRRIWHPVYFNAEGSCIQLWLTQTDTQMRNIEIRTSPFQLHAICIFAQPTSRTQ